MHIQGTKTKENIYKKIYLNSRNEKTKTEEERKILRSKEKENKEK